MYVGFTRLVVEAVKTFRIEDGARGESLMVHGGGDEEPAPRLFVEYLRNIVGGSAASGVGTQGERGEPYGDRQQKQIQNRINRTGR